MRVCPLASGSKGNSTFIESDNKRILIDVGLSGKMISSRLDDINVDIESIDGVFITHEHSDHIGGAGVIARKFGVPIFIHEDTFLAKRKLFNGSEKIHFINSTVTLGDMEIDPISVSHDAVNPLAFKISSSKQSVGVVTDLGIATQLVKYKMRDCNVLVLEMNHDIKMLQSSEKYPWELKQRILSNYGHLSNEAGAELFNEIVSEKTSHVFLAHLSEENNDPNLAKDVLLEINQSNKFIHNIKIEIAEQHHVSSLVEVTSL